MTAAGGRATLALLCVFAAGVFAGIFLDRHHLHPGGSAAANPSAQTEHALRMAELTEALELDAGQIRQVEAMIAERQELVERMWEQLRPEVQASMQEVHEQMVEILRPEQRELFHEWLMREREHAEGPSLH